MLAQLKVHVLPLSTLSTASTMSGNADASEGPDVVPIDSGSIDGSDEELSIGAAYKNLHYIALVVSTWVAESSKYTRHLELGVEDLSTKLAVVMSTMQALITNPEHTQSPSFYRSYCDVIATHDELSEDFKAMVDEKRRRLTPQSSLE